MTLNDRLARHDDLTRTLYENPYDLVRYLERATVYTKLGYHDLAIGDANRALLLTDEVQDEAGEYHEVAQEALRPYLKRDHSTALQGDGDISRRSGGDKKKALPAEEPGSLEDAADEGLETSSESEDTMTAVSQLGLQKAFQCYVILSQSLRHCGCLKSALHFTYRGLAAFPENAHLREMEREIKIEAAKHLGKDPSELERSDMDKFPDRGQARRDIYPWNEHEPGRFSDEVLATLNQEMTKVAPKCEVQVTELPILAGEQLAASAADGESKTIKQLGIFAKADIESNEIVLKEESVLIANNRLHESLCDACSSVFPDITSTRQPLDIEAVSQVVSCPDCQDVYFCNDKCLRLAQETYHPAVCGKDVETIGKNVPLKQTNDALYLLLLLRVISVAETTSTHPLNLKETKYIWGDFGTNATLPFSFDYNIALPLHILENLDLDIFATLPLYDTWILNTLYAKFRGTASARVSLRDGRPEVCAVHPMWCLANHSCDPNVAWEWAGEMRFWARERRVSRSAEGHKTSHEGVGPVGTGKRGGIARGEEILNHYCDIELPVKERREWAVGSLGGWCMCERCVREEREEQAKVSGLADGIDSLGVRT